MVDVTDCNEQVANKVNANDLGRAGKEGLRTDWEEMGEHEGYESDLMGKC